MLLLAIFMPTLVQKAAASDRQYPPVAVATLPTGLPTLASASPNDQAILEYGQFLFQTPLLSRDQTVACVTCHDFSHATSGSRPVAVGVGGALGRRHPPVVFNLYAAKSLMWDGRASGLAEQIPLPLESPSEMDVDWPTALARLSDHADSRRLLGSAPQRTIDRQFVLSALTFYIGSLVTAASAFDRYYYQGEEDALSQDAKEGLNIFVRKGRCSSCHLITGHSALLTDNNFHSIGIGFANGEYKDAGRFNVTGQEADRGLFKTPSLRNVALRRYFMHDGGMSSLREVVEYYNRGGNQDAPNRDGRIRPLGMTVRETEQLVIFLQALNSPIVSYRPQQ
jgi:cytochrome c peroxidase